MGKVIEFIKYILFCIKGNLDSMLNIPNDLENHGTKESIIGAVATFLIILCCGGIVILVKKIMLKK
jgi:hypothetical protein